MDTTRNTTFIIRGRCFAFQETLAAGKLIHEILWEGNGKQIDFVFKIDPFQPLMKLGERDFHRRVNDGFLRLYNSSKNFKKKFEIPISGGSHEPYLILKPYHGYRNKKDIMQALIQFGAENKQENHIDINMILNDSESLPHIVPDALVNDTETLLQSPIYQILQQKDLIALCLQGKNEDVANLLSSDSSQSIPILEKTMALDLLITMNAIIENKTRMIVIGMLFNNISSTFKSDFIPLQEKQRIYGIMNQSVHREYYHVFIAALSQHFNEINCLPNELQIYPVIFMPMYMQKLSNEMPVEMNNFGFNRQHNKNNVSKLR